MSSSISPDPIITLPGNIQVRAYTNADIPSISRHGNSKAIWNNLRNRMPHPYTESDADYWINQQANHPDKLVASGPWDPEGSSRSSGPKVPANYAVVVEGEAVGGIGLGFGDPVDVYARAAEIGYWIGEAYWGRSIMSKVVPAFVDWAFPTFGILVRLNGEVYERNVASRKVLEKAGFRVEGRREKLILKNGQLYDALFLGMLRPGLVSL